MATLTALLDACVLYPQTLRDLLLNLARTDLFRARWTDLINDEWTRKLLEKNRLRHAKLLVSRFIAGQQIGRLTLDIAGGLEPP